MSLPKVLAQILFQGSVIVGRAFLEAGRQAARNARAGQMEAAAGAAGAGAGAGGAGGGSITDQITRAHRMTMDEAKMILNFKEESKALELPTAQEVEAMIKSYEHLFKTNAPPAPKGQTGGGAGSFYIQSKVVRARERIEAEWEGIRRKQQQDADTTPEPNEQGPANPGNSPPGPDR
ncbi:hypothetical protein K437DRAFT_65935 [Tilletiaria anomala UBC 951]|uniref:Mitochondrial import inner membrane translocase subunit TIM16 n=1 Tax=Tilletiaria anomala (strain ATCC 24038 / CBS 436.72 / UBC 951) TaxID=1037660 RepID=A0A066W9K1_TILAU|nr:uncharacterized protein K437DRAFT_65935 [Tilletiaria anomala UBC 951]KDN50386.1 hypothetical protein K437DRAFT_65935 [Tilletiaria anomala UBC 951]